jgi:N-carbamoyl-L-amino-acid hydrolase
MKINSKRLEENIIALAQFGLNEKGGVDRSLGSNADIRAREWLVQKALSLGMKVHMDAISNIWMKTGEADLRPITIGSHHDAVPNGGKYDGAMGVLLGLEVAETLLENNAALKHPFQVVSFTAEEPNPYNISTMGSRSVTGKLPKRTLMSAVHSDNGTPLSAAISRSGGNLEQLENSQLSKGDMAAFIECHIEQGRVLFEKNLPTAVVPVITGIYRELITVKGEVNHAGTTIMKHRHDAMLAGAEAALALEEVIKSINSGDVVGTVGKYNIYPNSANIIPGEAQFILEVRTPNKQIKEQIIEDLNKEFMLIEEKRGVAFNRQIILDQPEALMDRDIIEALLSGDKNMPAITSMAGHDAVHMSGIAKTAMLFVKSINGKSHCAEEATDIEDIEAAGNILVEAVLKLDKQLD